MVLSGEDFNFEDFNLGGDKVNKLIDNIKDWVKCQRDVKLVNENNFGTYERYTDIFGKQDYENGICIDHLTGMGLEYK